MYCKSYRRIHAEHERSGKKHRFPNRMRKNDTKQTGRTTPLSLHPTLATGTFRVLYDVKKKRNGKHVFYIADPGKCLLKVEEEAFQKAWTGKEKDNDGKGILMALKPTDEFYRQHVAITSPCRYWTECRTSSYRTANTASVGNGKMYKSASNASMEDYSIHCFIPTLPFETFPTIVQLN